MFIDNQFSLTDNIATMQSVPQATIKEPVLRELVQAETSVGATVSGQQSGYAVQVRLGGGQKVLITSRGTIRLFASLDTAGAFVSGLGIPHFEVDMTGHAPGRLRKPRPDRAEAMRRTRTKLQQQPFDFLTGETP